MRAAFTTFGCKLNQYETEALASSLAGRGFSVVPAGEEADIYVINTCTVTSRSEQKARRLIRGLARRHPLALLVVTGCYAQLDREAISSLGSNILVVPQDRKDSLLDLPRVLEGQPLGMAFPAASGSPAGGDPFRYQVGRYRFHSRAFLKIQDGCDCRCAYCRVPLSRGPSVSLPPREVVRRAAELEQAGYREVVLTGVNISAWGSEGVDLAGLLRETLAATATTRLRLSSLEPERIGGSLAEAIRHPRVCPHFHLPIQSGSEAVLRRMRRRYRPERVAWAVRLLRESRDEAFLAADILVGFPGETEQDFLATWRLVEELDLARLHVFPFSPRPGTAAWRMKPSVPERIRDERAGRLLDFSDRLLDRYVSRWKGREVEAVLEESAGGSARMAGAGAGAPAGDEWIGLTGNYLKARIRGIPQEHAGRGRLVRLLIEETGPTCTGRFLSPA